MNENERFALRLREWCEHLGIQLSEFRIRMHEILSRNGCYRDDRAMQNWHAHRKPRKPRSQEVLRQLYRFFGVTAEDFNRGPMDDASCPYPRNLILDSSGSLVYMGNQVSSTINSRLRVGTLFKRYLCEQFRTILDAKKTGKLAPSHTAKSILGCSIEHLGDTSEPFLDGNLTLKIISHLNLHPIDLALPMDVRDHLIALLNHVGWTPVQRGHFHSLRDQLRPTYELNIARVRDDLIDRTIRYLPSLNTDTLLEMVETLSQLAREMDLALQKKRPEVATAIHVAFHTELLPKESWAIAIPVFHDLLRLATVEAMSSQEFSTEMRKHHLHGIDRVRTRDLAEVRQWLVCEHSLTRAVIASNGGDLLVSV
jgi:hypothetical protein